MYLAKAKDSFTIKTSTGYTASFEKDKLYSMRIVLGFISGEEDTYHVKDKFGFEIPFDKESYEENFETVDK